MEELKMYAVGIDVSKGKSTVAIVSTDGKIIEKPFEITHNDDGIKILLEKILKTNLPLIKFELREPTLHEIFVEKVGNAHEE